MKKTFKKQDAFTLIEIVIYVTILATILTVVSSLFVTFLSARAKEQVVIEVEQQGNQVMQIITQTIRNAKVLNSPALAASTTSMSLNVVDSAKSPTVFTLNTGTIQIQEGSAAAVNLTSNRVTASALTFRNLSRNATIPQIVRIQFTLTHVNGGKRNEYNYSQTFYGSASLR